MKKKLCLGIIMMMVFVFGTTLTAFAGYTPKYESKIPEIPDISVELSDEMKDAIDKAVQEQIRNMILDKPVVTHASCWQYNLYKDVYSTVSVYWNSVDNATSYKIEIIKQDGTSKTYTSQWNCFVTNSYKDEFIDGMENATVRIRAYGDNDTYSMWSDKVNIQFNAK